MLNIGGVPRPRPEGETSGGDPEVIEEERRRVWADIAADEVATRAPPRRPPPPRWERGIPRIGD